MWAAEGDGRGIVPSLELYRGAGNASGALDGGGPSIQTLDFFRRGRARAFVMEILNKLKSLDAYPKINEDFHTRTFSGGVITVISSIIILLLFISETSAFLSFFPLMDCCLLNLVVLGV